MTAKVASCQRASSADLSAIELNFRRDPSIYDGRFANNGWLQELPKPLTKLTWDNPVMIGPAMAERMKLNFKDVVELEFQGKKVKGADLDPGRTSRQLGHRSSSATDARAPDAQAPARVTTRIRCAPARIHGSRVALSFAPPARLTRSPAPKVTRRWKRPWASVRWCMERDLEEYKKEPNFAKEGEIAEGTDALPEFRLLQGNLFLGHGD